MDDVIFSYHVDPAH